MATISYSARVEGIKEYHLPYIEQDLQPYELVSLCFLLYGDDKQKACDIVKKLVTYIGNPNGRYDFLKKYAEINRNGSWKKDLIEALAVIEAKRVLRKLGFIWNEITIDIHPLLKAFYKMIEDMTPDQAKEMILYISNSEIQLKDYSYLEIFILDWISRDVIKIGNKNSLCRDDIDIHRLLRYFEIAKLDSMKEFFQRVVSDLKTIENSRQVFGNNDRSNCYQVRTDKAGFVLIFNQVNFVGKLEERKGSHFDKNRVANIFQSRGYLIKAYDDLKTKEIKQNIAKYVHLSKDYDSIVVIILSHGKDGLVYGSDSIAIPIDDIHQLLCSPLLEKKPKMLFIQACQNKDPKLCVNQDSKNASKLKQDAVGKATVQAPTMYADTIKGMATIPGFWAYRLPTSGAWYIQDVCDVIDRIGDTADIATILTETTNVVSRRKGENNEIMLPTYSSTLTKLLYLPPKKKDFLDFNDKSKK